MKVVKVAGWLIIILILCVYISNIFSWDEKPNDYGVSKDESFEVYMDAIVTESPLPTGEVKPVGEIKKGIHVKVLDKEGRFAKVMYDNEERYIRLWNLSDEAKEAKTGNEYLVFLDNATALYEPNENSTAHPDTYSGLGKVVATYNGYSRVVLADFEKEIYDMIWVKDENLGQYNSLKIDIGTLDEDAELYAALDLQTVLDEDVRWAIKNGLVKITEKEVQGDLIKVKSDEGYECFVERVEFNPVENANQIN